MWFNFIIGCLGQYGNICHNNERQSWTNDKTEPQKIQTKN